MTIEWIIERLGISGSGTKQEVLNRLKNMTLDELQEEIKKLKLSIDEEIKNYQEIAKKRQNVIDIKGD